MEKKLRECIDGLILKTTGFNLEGISDEATFRELGFSGLNLWDIEDKCREEFGILPDLNLDATLESLAEMLENACMGAC